MKTKLLLILMILIIFIPLLLIAQDDNTIGVDIMLTNYYSNNYKNQLIPLYNHEKWNYYFINDTGDSSESGLLEISIYAYDVVGFPDYIKTDEELNNYLNDYREKRVEYLMSHNVSSQKAHELVDKEIDKMRQNSGSEDIKFDAKSKEVDYKEIDYYMLEETKFHLAEGDYYRLEPCNIKLEMENNNIVGYFETMAKKSGKENNYEFSGKFTYKFTVIKDGKIEEIEAKEYEIDWIANKIHNQIMENKNNTNSSEETSSNENANFDEEENLGEGKIDWSNIVDKNEDSNNINNPSGESDNNSQSSSSNTTDENTSEQQNSMTPEEEAEMIRLSIERNTALLIAEKILPKADNYASQKNYVAALENYEVALLLIKENNLEYLIPAELVEERIRRMKAAIKVNQIIEEGNAYFNENKYDMASERYNTAVEFIYANKIENLMSDELKYLVKLLIISTLPSEINGILKKADILAFEKKYEEAIANYEIALFLVRENNLEEKIEPEPIEQEIRRMEAAIEVNQLVEEGNVYIEEKDYSKARKKYEEAIEIIGKEHIEDIMFKEIQNLVNVLKMLILPSEINQLVESADNLASQRDFALALSKYETALFLIKENKLEKQVNPEPIEDQMRRMNAAIKVEKLIEEGNAYVDDGNYYLARAKYDEVIEIVNEEEIEDIMSEEIQSLVNKLSALILPSEINQLIEKGDNLVIEGEFALALSKYETALFLIKENKLEEKIDPEPIEEQIERMKAAAEAKKLINEADKYLEENSYYQAIDKYNEAIDLINKEDISDLVSAEDVINTRNQIKPDDLSYYYITVGGGGGFGQFGYVYQGLTPAWDLSFTYTLSRYFAIGAGINLFYLELFTKTSFINTYGMQDMSSELLIKTGVLLGFITSLEVGGGVSVEYLLRWDFIGFYADLGAYVTYSFDYSEMFFFGALRLGIVFNF